MTDLSKVFEQTYNSVMTPQKDADLTPDYKTQLDALQDIAKNITESGEFDAVLGSFSATTPSLSITHRQDKNLTQKFIVTFATLCGKPRIVLATGPQNAPLENKDHGYNLTNKMERHMLVTDLANQMGKLATEMAKAEFTKSLQSKAVQYINAGL